MIVIKTTWTCVLCDVGMGNSSIYIACEYVKGMNTSTYNDTNSCSYVLSCINSQISSKGVGTVRAYEVRNARKRT